MAHCQAVDLLTIKPSAWETCCISI